MRTHGLYVSKRLFEAVFGKVRRDEGNVTGSTVHHDPEADLLLDRQAGAKRGRTPYHAPVGRRRRV